MQSGPEALRLFQERCQLKARLAVLGLASLAPAAALQQQTADTPATSEEGEQARRKPAQLRPCSFCSHAVGRQHLPVPDPCPCHSMLLSTGLPCSA